MFRNRIFLSRNRDKLDSMDLKEEDILGNAIHAHWYYVSKGRAMLQLLRGVPCGRVLDVGAGSGIFSKQLIDHGRTQDAICVDPGYDSDRQEQYHGQPISFVRSVNWVDRDVILMMDVLEHVDDDIALLRQYTASAPKGTHVLITVPAFRFLWSGHDVFLEHRRRYTAAMIEGTVRAAGLEVVRTRYFFGLLFPVIAVLRLYNRLRLGQGTVIAKSDLKLYPEWLNNTLIAIHNVERLSVFPINKLAGLSVFCLCKAP